MGQIKNIKLHIVTDIKGRNNSTCQVVPQSKMLIHNNSSSRSQRTSRNPNSKSLRWLKSKKPRKLTSSDPSTPIGSTCVQPRCADMCTFGPMLGWELSGRFMEGRRETEQGQIISV